jgi:hypothetical protein
MLSIRVTPSCRAAAALLLPGVLLILAGCTGKPTGVVSGTVKYKGAPVTAGVVYFYDPTTGQAAPGQLDDSGNFKLDAPLLAGTYKVYLNPPIPEQLPPGQAPKKAPRFDLPPKYQDPAQTPVSKEVKAGANTIPIDLN